MNRNRGIAFVGTYLPRTCGIATFTYDLAEAVAEQSGRIEPVIVAAMNDRPGGYVYPDRVTFELRQDYRTDYSRAADFLNHSRIDVISLQHEYGIYGGEAGSDVLTLLRDLHRPVVVTCHTVLQEPDPVHREILEEIAARSEMLVAMSRRACTFLEEVYGVGREKITCIPHGIHNVSFIDPCFYKDKFGMEGRRVVLTFGLLHRIKGIENMIEAMPAIVDRHPDTIYLVLGPTHPAIVREEGEAYRLGLQRRVRELGLGDHVIFNPRFVDIGELLEYLGAADIVVTPYLSEEQATSGSLIYAMGSGKAVVSTPYWYAKELLADGRGRLVPIADPGALEREINDLLDDEVALNVMRRNAYSFCRNMVWSSVADDYMRVFNDVRRHLPFTVVMTSSTRRLISSTNLPQPRLEHLMRLTDDTGPFHFARFSLPDRASGYHMQDAALVLVVSAKYHDLFGVAEAARLSRICLSLLQLLIGDGESVAGGLDYSRHRTGAASEEAIGKAIWALGYAVSHGKSTIYDAANDAFQQLMPHADLDGPCGAAHAVLGASSYLVHFPGAREVRRYLSRHASRLDEYCKRPDWIEIWDGPDWPVAAQALIISGTTLDRDEMRKKGGDLVRLLRERTFQGTRFLKQGDNPHEEELPMTAATFIEALGADFLAGRNADLLRPMRQAADWYLGANRLGEALYDFTTAGCHDALTASGLNLNKGVESTAYCLLAFLTLHELASVGYTSGSEE